MAIIDISDAVPAKRRRREAMLRMISERTGIDDEAISYNPEEEGGGIPEDES